MPGDCGKGNGNLFLGRTKALRKWGILFWLFFVILMVEQRWLPSPKPLSFSLLPVKGFQCFFGMVGNGSHLLCKVDEN